MSGITREDLERAFRTLKENNRSSGRVYWYAPLISGTPAVVGHFLRYYYSTLTDGLREEADEILASNELVRKHFMGEAE